MSTPDDGTATGLGAAFDPDAATDTIAVGEMAAAAATISDSAPVADVTGDGTAMFQTGSFSERYAPGELLGFGGMGDVRLFADRATGRAVAMKTVRRDREAGTGLRRFAREARIQAQLEHPAIVPVYDVGVDSENRLFFTMKRVRGQSLADVLTAMRNAGPATAPRYSLRKLLTVLGSVAMAIEYAHSRGVIHRDLKPANVMMGAFDEVYVLDWGLSDVRGPDGRHELPPIPANLADLDSAPVVDSSQRPDTATGLLVGTPGYVAPELLKRGEHAPDHRTDVYALGVILFEILTLERLHTGQRVGEILSSTLTTDGGRARIRAPYREVPPELDELCRAATRLDPDARPPSARAFARAIEAFLDGDQNLAMRRQLATRSSDAAALALAQSRVHDLGDSDEAALRTLALREVTTALGLDPDNLSARSALVRLLTEPPRHLPRAADDATRTARRRTLRIASRNAVFAHLTYALYVPLLLWMGVRHWWMLAVMAGAISSVIAVSYHYYRHPPSDLRVPWPHLAVSTLAMASGTVLFGPLVLVPAIVLATGVGYIASVDHRHAWITALGVLVIVVPTLLQALGVLPPSYEFVDGAIRILPRMASFPPGATLAFLLLTQVVILITCQIYIAHLRHDYLEAEARLRLQAWQLGQIVPEDARSLLSS